MIGGGIEGLLTRVDRYEWLEGRLFTALGASATTVDRVAVSALLAGHSRQHAWHAELWRERRPVLTSTRPDPARPDPPAALAGLFDELSGTGSAVAVLAAVHRGVVGHLVSAYRREQRQASAAQDLPTERICRLVLLDLHEEWAAGQEALQSALVDDDGCRSAADWTSRADAAMAGYLADVWD